MSYDRRVSVFLPLSSREYQRIESVQDYLIVAQNEPQVWHHERQSADSWLMMTYSGLDTIIELKHLKLTLRRADIHAKVRFD